MESPFRLYSKFLALLCVVTLMVGFNFVRFGFHRQPVAPTWSVADGNARRGPDVMAKYGCAACHIVPGASATTATVGPRLDQLSSQLFLAGTLPNTPESFVMWVQNPQELRPGTAMPELQVADQDARDLAAFFYSSTNGARP